MQHLMKKIVTEQVVYVYYVCSKSISSKIWQRWAINFGGNNIN